MPGEESAPVPPHIVSGQNDVIISLQLLCVIAIAFGVDGVGGQEFLST